MRWRLQHRQRWSRVQYDFSCPFISAHRHFYLSRRSRPPQCPDLALTAPVQQEWALALLGGVSLPVRAVAAETKVGEQSRRTRVAGWELRRRYLQPRVQNLEAGAGAGAVAASWRQPSFALLIRLVGLQA